MSAARIVLWRHGRTEWNATGRFQGQSDPPLDDLGRAQADLAAAALLDRYEPELIVSSDLQRARATAEALRARAGLAVHLDERLRETHFGPWQGLTHDEIASAYPEAYQRWRAGRPHGLEAMESAGSVQSRVRAAIDEASLRADGLVVVVTHGGAARRALGSLLGWEDDVVRGLAGLDNCHWSEVRRGERGWRLQAHNVGAEPPERGGRGGGHGALLTREVA